MIKLLLTSIGLAASDCLDPLSISVQIYLLTTKQAILNSLAFIAGILISTLICGSVITLGPIKELDKFFEHPKAIYFVFQTIVGFLLLYGSYHYWYHFAHKKSGHPKKFKVNPASCFLLGSSFTITDLPTNIPLLALAEELAKGDYNILLVILGCLTYSVTRIVPLMVIIGLFATNKDRAEKWIKVAEAKLLKWGHLFVTATISVLGIALIIDSAAYFLFGKPLFVL